MDDKTLSGNCLASIDILRFVDLIFASVENGILSEDRRSGLESKVAVVRLEITLVQWSPGMRSNLLDQKGKHEDITRCQTN
jgi:hypothetical protein